MARNQGLCTKLTYNSLSKVLVEVTRFLKGRTALSKERLCAVRDRGHLNLPCYWSWKVQNTANVIEHLNVAFVAISLTISYAHTRKCVHRTCV